MGNVIYCPPESQAAVGIYASQLYQPAAGYAPAGTLTFGIDRATASHYIQVRTPDRAKASTPAHPGRVVPG